MSRPVRRGWLRAVLVGLLVLAGVLVPGGAASAHTALVSSVPGDGEALPVPPAQLVLTFDDEVVDLGAQAVVTGPDGAEVPVTGVDVDGAVVTWSLAPDVPAGAYAVAWRVTAADGHPVEGSLAYSAGAPASSAAALVEDPEAAPPPATPVPEPAPETVPEPEMTTMDDSRADESGAPVDPLAPPSGGSTAAWLLLGLGAVGTAVTVLVRRRRT